MDISIISDIQRKSPPGDDRVGFPLISLDRLLRAYAFQGFVSFDQAFERLRSGSVSYFGLQSLHVLTGFPTTGRVSPGRLGHFIGLVDFDGRWICSDDATWRLTTDLDALFDQARLLLGRSGMTDRFSLVSPRFHRYADDEDLEDRSAF